MYINIPLIILEIYKRFFIEDYETYIDCRRKRCTGGESNTWHQQIKLSTRVLPVSGRTRMQGYIKSYPPGL